MHHPDTPIQKKQQAVELGVHIFPPLATLL
jgi:hypothetical protein